MFVFYGFILSNDNSAVNAQQSSDRQMMMSAEEGNEIIALSPVDDSRPDVHEYFTKIHTLPAENVLQPIEEYEGMVGNVGSDMEIKGRIMPTDKVMNTPPQILLGTANAKNLTEATATVTKNAKADPMAAGSRFMYQMRPSNEPLAKMKMPEPSSLLGSSSSSSSSSASIDLQQQQHKGDLLLFPLQDSHSLAESREENTEDLRQRIKKLEEEIKSIEGPNSPLLTQVLTESIIYGAHAVAAAHEENMSDQGVVNYKSGDIADVHALDEQAGDHMDVSTIESK